MLDGPLEELVERLGGKVAQRRVLLVHHAAHDAVEQLDGLAALVRAIAREPVHHLHDERGEEVARERVRVARESKERRIHAVVHSRQLIERTCRRCGGGG